MTKSWKGKKRKKKIWKDNLIITSRSIVILLTKIIIKHQPRDKDKEFIELVIIKIGETLPSRVKIRQSGAYHHASWIIKYTFNLNIILLRSDFKITKTEKNIIYQICEVIVKFYIKYWCTVTNVRETPFNDINLICAINT